jgi:hypothetical protein
MRILIREYLNMLKERDELDSLVPDLLLSMDIEVIRKPQRGVPEHGVDVAGVGPDPDPNEDGQRTLFLFTIKDGDIDRQKWDASGDLQGVRRSLNDIRDGYLPHRVSQEHADLPVKIVLCCGGEMKRNVEDRWSGYVDRNTEDGELEYEFWGGGRLSVLIEEHMLDENLFPGPARKQIRKTISLVDENEHPPHHFYDLSREQLFDRNLPTGNSSADIQKRREALNLLHLSLNIVFHWSREADNLRPALLSSERAVLTVWDWMRSEDLFESNETFQEFSRIFATHFSVLKQLILKVAPHCQVQHGLFQQGFDRTEYPIRTFELIGILGATCAIQSFFADALPDEKVEVTKEFFEEGAAVRGGSDLEKGEEVSAARLAEQETYALGEILSQLIRNNPSALTPCYDEHVIDISIGLLGLLEAGRQDVAEWWVHELARRIPFAYGVLGCHFPISTDSYEDHVAMRVGTSAPPKEELMQMSTLLPILAHWHAVLDMPKSYQVFAEEVKKTFSETHLQIWYPDESTEDHLYRENAGRSSGATLSPIDLPSSLERLKAQIQRLADERLEYEDLSCFEQGWPILSLIASRHFRTPVPPVFWQQHVSVPASSEAQE